MMLRQCSTCHPNGQMPAYEWNFSDVNPPVHAFATLFLLRTEQGLRGETDLQFLKSTFNKLLLNFTWWVNRKAPLWQERVRGGLSWSRQHWRVRSQRPTSHRRPPRASGRHGLDGPVPARTCVDLAFRDHAARDSTYESMIMPVCRAFLSTSGRP